MDRAEREGFTGEMARALDMGDRDALALVISRFARRIAEERRASFPAGFDLDDAIQDATINAIVWIGECDFRPSDLHVWVWRTVKLSLSNSARSQSRWRRKHSQMPDGD
jgi:hypothetical protein